MGFLDSRFRGNDASQFVAPRPWIRLGRPLRTVYNLPIMADPAKILVVDDEPDTVGLLELTLRTAGYEIQSARSGQEGLRMALEEAFDLLLLDVMMPDLTGFDLMRSLQELHGASEKAPVVILTARDRPEDREIGQRLGAVGYLLKPATRGQLVDAIRKALDSSPGRGASA